MEEVHGHFIQFPVFQLTYSPLCHLVYHMQALSWYSVLIVITLVSPLLCDIFKCTVHVIINTPIRIIPRANVDSALLEHEK